MDALETTTQVRDKRKHERINGSFNANIETICLGGRNVVCKNISEGGIYIEASFNKLDFPNTAIVCLRNEIVTIKINIGNHIVKTVGIVKWIKEVLPSHSPTDKRFSIGIQFTNIHPEELLKIREHVGNAIKYTRPTNTILEFPLLINGKEVDTGRHEYQPYMEKFLTDPSHTSFVIKNLKQGKFVDKYNEYVYGKYCIADETHFQEAINSAHEASLIYKTFDIDRRTKIAVDTHKRLLKHKDEFINLLMTEGHPRKLAEWEMTGMLKSTCPETLHFYRMNLEATLGTDKNEKIMLYRKPDGVVCLATPKNAPSSISLMGLFPLMAGNALIIKPPLSIPISTIYLWKDIVFKAVLENGAPPGIINIVIGNSNKIFQSWLKSPHVDDVIYIGDTKKGLEIGNQIFNAGKKPILELSGNDKVIVWKDAPLNKASDALLECFHGSSQICMVPKMAFIHQDIFDEFMKIFIEKVKKLKPGLPSDPDTVLSPVGKIGEFKQTLEDAIQKGGNVLHGGIRLNHYNIQDDNGMYLQPTVITFQDTKILADTKCLTEENFYPLLPIIKISGKDDKEIFDKMIKFIEMDGFGLRISIWTLSENYIDKFVTNIIPGGIVRVNSSHIGFSLYLANNGGTGKSGGPYGEMNYMWQKTTHLQGVSISSPHNYE